MEPVRVQAMDPAIGAQRKRGHGPVQTGGNQRQGENLEDISGTLNQVILDDVDRIVDNKLVSPAVGIANERGQDDRRFPSQESLESGYSVDVISTFARACKTNSDLSPFCLFQSSTSVSWKQVNESYWGSLRESNRF